MLKHLGIQSKKDLLENKGILTLSWITTIGHTISNLFLLLWNLNNILIYKYHSGVSILLVFNYFWNIIKEYNFFVWAILLIVFIILGYFVFFPIAYGSVLEIIAHKTRFSKALGVGLSKFFIFFEYNTLITSFSIITFFITIARLFTLNVLENFFIISLLSLWGILVILLKLFLPFAKILIAIEGYDVYPAIKKSMSLAISNFGKVIKATIYQIFLFIFFYFRIGILFLIPTIVMYIIIYFQWFTNGFGSLLLWIFGITGILLFSYVNAIIYAFFESYRYNIFLEIKEE
ncbi:MAG: hypothetical protein CR971_01640 [candidate division SR1 bacterium]|nr:MAG: hypothetical protein CR971_01640 [candidate division SR1 bacterium]